LCAICDALAGKEGVNVVMQDDQLLTIAREVAQTVRNNASIDWRQREQVKAKLRTTVRRVLRKHGYPPDQTPAAIQLILEQAEALADDQTS